MLDMEKKLSKNTYYLDFTTEQLIGGKELLKSMPMFYNRVYFCKKYANALWNGSEGEHFADITMIAREEDIPNLRQIIKNNFLYISGWDSVKFSEEGDYGFSFIGGNLKYVVIPFKETENGYNIKSYDVNTGMCYDTLLNVNKQFFLDSSINARGEFVRTCDFNPEDRNDTNTKSKMAAKKAQPQMAVYNGGFALSKAPYVILVALLCLIVLWAVYLFYKFSLS